METDRYDIMKTPLSPEERGELTACEEKIRRGLEVFYEVGRALMRIRDNRLYREEYSTFDAYCREEWGMSHSTGYHLMYAAQVVDNLGDAVVPSKASHAANLRFLPADVQRSAWAEVMSITDSPTGDLVTTIAQKHYVLHAGGPLAEKIERQEIAPRRAFQLEKTIQRLPAYYGQATYAHGLEAEGVDPAALDALRILEFDFRDEVKEILVSGYLQDGVQEIPLFELTSAAVKSYGRRLYAEATDQRRLVSGDKQKENLPTQVVVADGTDIYEQVEAHAQGRALMHLFPEGAMRPTELAAFLEKNNCHILMVVAYTADEPDVNFDGIAVKPSRINGVKPAVIQEMISHSVLPS